ncbi:hypothetical protein NZK33_06620 [Cyanobium sp. FGCU-6]|nr:hypothetical protein [Cyanobium sp. FGCU6]
MKNRTYGELCLVRSTGNGCLIYRDMVGRFVVLHAAAPEEGRPVATLAGAYAECRGLEEARRAIEQEPAA